VLPHGTRGLPDVLGLLPPSGRLPAVEVKRPGGRVSPDQRAFLDAVNAAGGVGLVVDDVTQLARELDRLGV
jgi:hypothetical protein